MNAQLNETTKTTETRITGNANQNRLVGGVLLVGAGLILLLSQFVSIGAWFLIILGLGFVAAGIVTHAVGWFIPGGVLNGIGLGALLTDHRVVTGDPAEGGLFLLTFALGWASIYILTRIFTNQPQKWALIPAGIMALIGTPLLIGPAGEAALDLIFNFLGYLWPLALIAAGIVVLTRRGRQ